MDFSNIDIVVTLFVAALGVASGYCLRGWKWAAPERLLNSDTGKDRPQDDKQRRAQEALDHLHDLATRVAADVGAHSDRVQEINDELIGSDQSSESVLAAMNGLIAANQRMQQQLDTAETRLQLQAKQLESIEEQALTDALTGIANRRAFNDFTARQHAEFERHGRPVTVLMIDVDRFKAFNDTYGHSAGDEVLRGVAAVLEETMREVDLVARYGGEEFSVVFPGTKVGEATPAAERARAAIESAVFHHAGTDLKVTASFGLAELRADEPIANAVKRADKALYAAKKAGRNNVHWHDGEASYPAFAESCEKERAGDGVDGQPSQREPVAQEADTDVGGDEFDSDRQTRLSNRQAFVEDVHRRLAEWKRTRNPLSLILLYIDDLDGIRARLGGTGEHVTIQAATQFLQAAMREMDHVARFDRETFALLLPAANLASAEMIAERLRHAIAKCALPVAGKQLHFTISLGVADARTGDDSAKLLVRAETALDEAIAAGGDCTFVHIGRNAQPTETGVVGGKAEAVAEVAD